MNFKNILGCSGVGYLKAVILMSSVLAFSVPGRAAVVSLSDNNSIANVDLDSAAGMYEWKVDGQNQLNKQWFYYRIGNTGVAQPINAINPVASYTAFGANGVLATYVGAQVTLEVSYYLTGGSLGSGTADILESITAYNNTATPLDFHLFQYSDFDLGGTPGGDSISISGLPGAYDYVLQSKGGMSIGEAIVSPEANRAETDAAFNTLTSLTSTPGYNLNNSVLSGPGNVTWALQWDANIAVGGSLDIFKDKKLEVAAIPEPSILTLLVVGLSALGLVSRRRIP